MALFGGKSKDGEKKRRRFLEKPEIDTRSDATTVLAEPVIFEGDIRAAGDAILAGKVAGNVEVAGRLVFHKSGHVRGAVFADQARVEGTVEGPVTVKGKLEVGQSARIDGDLTAGVLAIAEGALVRGSLNSATEPHQFTERRQV
jgi:cytoskeletal protein CcmA (bactofilin family)